MASFKEVASLLLLGLYGFIALRVLLTWWQQRRQRRWRNAAHSPLASTTFAAKQTASGRMR